VLSERNPSEVFGEIGAFLFRLLVRDRVYAEWDALLNRFPRDEPPHEGIRTVLDIDPPELRALPWELMYHHPHRPFTNVLSPVVRGRIQAGSQPPPYRWPIRVLIVIGCKEDDGIQWENELHGIEDALRPLHHAVDPEVLPRPSRELLFETIRSFRPDIFHFIGHGRGGRAGARLELYDGRDRWYWKVDEMVADLQEYPPQLAILNACHSAEPDDQYGAWSVTEAFAAIGTMAVLGMYGDVPGDAAATFGAQVYEALAEGKFIDTAVAAARGGVSRLSSEDGYLRRDWSLASLVVSNLPDRVLRIKPEIPERFARLSQIPEFDEIRDFVDRTQQRRKLWRSLAEAEPHSPDLLLIVGEEEAGKSAMLRWCLQTCALQGHQVFLRDFRGRKTRDFAEVLGAIVEGNQVNGSPLQQPLDPPSAFEEFRELLGALQSSRTQALPLLSAAAPPDRLVPKLMEAFRTGLMAAAGGQPLTLALDHLFGPGGVLEDDFAKYLRPHFVNVAARRELSPVRLILTATESDFRHYGLDSLAAGDAVVEVRKFQAEEFRSLLAEFLLFHTSREKRQKLDQAMKALPDRLWRPVELREFKRLFVK
jgi:hypothetical protein